MDFLVVAMTLSSQDLALPIDVHCSDDNNFQSKAAYGLALLTSERGWKIKVVPFQQLRDELWV